MVADFAASGAAGGSVVRVSVVGCSVSAVNDFSDAGVGMGLSSFSRTSSAAFFVDVESLTDVDEGADACVVELVAFFISGVGDTAAFCSFSASVGLSNFSAGILPLGCPWSSSPPNSLIRSPASSPSRPSSATRSASSFSDTFSPCSP